ncbi:MAG: ERF family protein [Chlamydiota bacterium]|nr:ERF family protein [Chlamydiota bacterium]
METPELLHIQSLLQDLSKRVEELAASKIVQPERFMSEEIKDLAVALAKAQSEMPIADLNKTNPYFKSAYADMKSIVCASRPSLTKYGISVVQNIVHHDDGQSILHTMLLHSSGQYICSKMRIVPAKNDIQTISSYTTYLKRMAYASLVGVITGDEDDDGEASVATSRDTFAKGTALNTKYDPRDTSPEVITREQLEELNYELAEYTDIAQMVLDSLKIQSLADMPKKHFIKAIGRIREIKMTRNGK